MPWSIRSGVMFLPAVHNCLLILLHACSMKRPTCCRSHLYLIVLFFLPPYGVACLELFGFYELRKAMVMIDQSGLSPMAYSAICMSHERIFSCDSIIPGSRLRLCRLTTSMGTEGDPLNFLDLAILEARRIGGDGEDRQWSHSVYICCLKTIHCRWKTTTFRFNPNQQFLELRIHIFNGSWR